MQAGDRVGIPAWEACGCKLRRVQKNHLANLFSGGNAECRKSAEALNVKTGQCISHYVPEMDCVLIGLASIACSLMLHLTDDALLEGWQLLPGQHLAEVEVWCQQQGRVQLKVSISLAHTHTVCLLEVLKEEMRKRGKQQRSTYQAQVPLL